jgi:2'-5' RNA ligase
MPHVNLMYPFLAAEHFNPRLLAALRDVLKTVPPFTVRLTEFGHFAHGRNATFFLPPTHVSYCLLCYSCLVFIFGIY